MSITAIQQHNHNQTRNIIHKSFICLKSFAVNEKKVVENYINKQFDREKYFMKVNYKNEINLYKFVQ
jgi:hypothetical protein